MKAGWQTESVFLFPGKGMIILYCRAEQSKENEGSFNFTFQYGLKEMQHRKPGDFFVP